MTKTLVQIENDQIIKKITLEKNRYTIGRGVENDIIFSTPKISRLHASLVREGDTYLLIDEQSTNHTFVNGERIERRLLAPGDTISLSREITLRYVEEEVPLPHSATAKFSTRWQSIGKHDFLRLKTVADRIISLDSLDHILQTILNEVIQVVGAERGFIALTDEYGRLQIETCVTHNLSLTASRRGKSLFAHSVVQKVIKKQESVFILNAQENKKNLSTSVIELDLRSIMCSPLLFDERLVGVLYVDSGRQVVKFTETDQLSFAILADFAAIAVENAKLFDRLKKSNTQLQAEVAESEARYQQLVEHSPDAILVHREGVIVYANPAAASLLGAQGEEDLLGRSIFDFHTDETRPLVEERIRALKAERIAAPPLEETFLRLDGKLAEMEVTGVPIQYQGEPAVMVIARDVTERKRMERELLRAQKLESVGVLAGGIAHDFNNALQAIIGNVLLAKMEAGSPSRVRACLEDVESAVSRAVSLTSQLLTFSRGGAPVTRAASIETLLRESATFVLRGSKSACRFEFEKDLPLVEMDSDQIYHVVHNLVLNAHQAMPMGGTITISARQIEVTGTRPLATLKPGRYVAVSVADEGIGIPPNMLDKIFDPYFTTKQEGSGLGLASCYSIITKHGGLIEACSEEGKGAVFTFYLPVSKKQTEEMPEATEEPMPGGRVLVMDDDEVVRHVTAAMLQTLGFRVATAADGAEAIRAYMQAKEEGDPFDVVIFDLTVPGGMGGREAIQRLRRLDPAVRAIVASGYSNDAVMAEPQRYGFAGVMSKPFDLHDVARTLKQVLVSRNGRKGTA